MKRFHLGLSILISALLSFFVCVNVCSAEQVTETTTTTTQTPAGNTVTKVVERRAITTPVPAAKETVATPSGYVSCFTVEGAWFNNIWVPSHRVCQYENAAEGNVWIEGYWACDAATAEGVCTNWVWKSGHWEKKLTVY